MEIFLGTLLLVVAIIAAGSITLWFMWVTDRLHEVEELYKRFIGDEEEED